MISQDTSNAVPPVQDQQDSITSSSELGSPPPTKGSSLNGILLRGPLEHQSPSLPPSSPFWDQMLPSSPSPGPKRDLPMDLDRFMERGFSEDLALPPRQIEKPFRFLDLPAEIRNMIYDLVLEADRWYYVPSAYYGSSQGSCPFWSSADWSVSEYLSSMKREWHPPRLSLVSKQLRHETLSRFYATNSFDWYWDPEHVDNDHEDANLMDSINFLEKAIAFLDNHNLWVQGINICSPGPHRYSVWALEPVIRSVIFLAPLSRSLIETGKAHQVLGKVKFGYNNSFSHRIFDFAGTLDSQTLGKRKWLDRDLRRVLRYDQVGAGLLEYIEEREANNAYHERHAREARKEERREDNLVKGAQRWNSVLRSRAGKGETGYKP